MIQRWRRPGKRIAESQASSFIAFSTADMTLKSHVVVIVWVLLFVAQRLTAESVYVRVNQLGYQPRDAKVAVAMGQAALPGSFQLVDPRTEKIMFEGKSRPVDGNWGAFDHHAELDFSSFEKEGTYQIRFAGIDSPKFSIRRNAYAALPDQLLEFMRQQRCGYNPWVDAVCHSFDGRTVDGPMPPGSYIDARGGWHDAGDQLKYLLTSSNATAQMLLAYQFGNVATPKATFADRVNDRGQPVPNGVPDLLDEARWGLDWMLRLHPSPDQLYHQVADDRDHETGFRLPQNETVDYGWGAGKYRACTRPTASPRVSGNIRANRTASRISPAGTRRRWGSRIRFGKTTHICGRSPNAASSRARKFTRWEKQRKAFNKATPTRRHTDMPKQLGPTTWNGAPPNCSEPQATRSFEAKPFVTPNAPRPTAGSAKRKSATTSIIRS
jgi:hypothetical protein